MLSLVSAIVSWMTPFSPFMELELTLVRTLSIIESLRVAVMIH